MATIENQSFSGENVIVDDNSYIGCSFVNCVIVFRGGEVPTFTRCSFSGIRIQLEEGAGQTIRYLSGLAKGGLESNVARVMDKIQEGSLVKTEPDMTPPLINTGRNYGQMATLSVGLISIAILCIVFMWYGFVYHPQAEILNGEEVRPLEAQIPLDIMPALPDDLAAAYDGSRADQLSDMAAYAWVDEEDGTVRIPIDKAIEVLLNQDDDESVAMAGE